MQVAAVLLASAPTSPGLQAAGPLQHAVVTQGTHGIYGVNTWKGPTSHTQGIWTGLKTASRQRAGVDMEEQEEQPGMCQSQQEL
eukprot:scaffold81467_cov24-Tisochrysis_lutea.AAC.2